MKNSVPVFHRFVIEGEHPPPSCSWMHDKQSSQHLLCEAMATIVRRQIDTGNHLKFLTSSCYKTYRSICEDTEYLERSTAQGSEGFGPNDEVFRIASDLLIFCGYTIKVLILELDLDQFQQLMKSQCHHLTDNDMLEILALREHRITKG